MSKLFEKGSWGKRDSQRLKKAFKSSGNVCFAFSNSKLIGCGRSVNDEEWYSLIVDVIVDPEFQRKGIGSLIMKSLISDTQDLSWVILASEVDKEKFYEKLGFHKMKFGYMLPKSEIQAETYCETIEN